CNDQLSWIAVIEAAEPVSANGDVIDEDSPPEVNFQPAIRAVADPARAVAIRAVVGELRLMDVRVSRDVIFCDCRPSKAVPLEGQVFCHVESLRPALWLTVARLTNERTGQRRRKNDGETLTWS